MRLRLISKAFAISLLPAAANAQVTLDMSAINCNQYLAMSPSTSRDFSADERLVQLSDPPNICGSRFAPEKHRKLESVVPIPSAR